METNSLYSGNDLKTMKLADSARLPGKNRVEEIRNYAKLAGLKRIGIANCVAVQKEANLLKDMLSNDFEVFAVDCKCGKMPSSEILGPEAKGISCNPSGQAEFLAENKTELNIVMGLCVGHDLVFNAKSKAPSTTLIVKDREHKHNPIETFK
ncbi:MAG TPA: DUF1847 domain-containing protein [Bacteroidales bacterium]